MSAHTPGPYTTGRLSFSPAIREAWGRSDALLHKQTGYIPLWRRGPKDLHFDKAYMKGYYSVIWGASE